MATILIVEDDERICEMIATFLRMNEFQCELAFTARDGVAKAETQHIDLIVLDIMLPDINGLDVCEVFREFTDAPIIFMSANRMYRSRLMDVPRCGSNFVEKPLNLMSLKQTIMGLLPPAVGSV